VAITLPFLAAWRDRLAIAENQLKLRHDELRELMVLVRRRTDAGSELEWAAINRLLGYATPPADPRAFLANLQARVGVLDFERDGLSQVSSVEDLHRYSDQAPVRAYIERELVELADPGAPAADRGASALAVFTAVMTIKERVDADWRKIHRLLERAGQRSRPRDPNWRLSPSDPTNVAALLTQALGVRGATWPGGTDGEKALVAYDREMRRLEDHFFMRVERLALVVDVAFRVSPPSSSPPSSPPSASLLLDKARWERLLSVLADAHGERFRARRRQALDQLRQQAQGGGPEDAGVLVRLVDRALQAAGSPPPAGALAWDWTAARAALSRELSRGELDVLDGFRRQLEAPGVEPRRFGWSEVYTVLEVAQRRIGSIAEPIARTVEWRHLVANADARSLRDDSGRWPAFGREPLWTREEPPEPTLGFALRSPLLCLSEGLRTVTLTLGFLSEGFDEALLRQRLAFDDMGVSPFFTELCEANLLVRVSGPKGWIDLPIQQAALSDASQDYWSLAGLAKPASAPARPALRLQLQAEASVAPFVPLKGEESATLQVVLRPKWENASEAWITTGALEPLRLEALHLRVNVEGLSALELQQEERRLDPRKPFEPFGAQPCVGAQLHLSHPELVRQRLDSLTFRLTWTGLGKPLASQYVNYRSSPKASDFQARLELIDQQRSLGLSLPPATAGGTPPPATPGVSVSLFSDPSPATGPTPVDRSLTILPQPPLPQTPDLPPRPDLTPGDDLRQDERVWRFTLTPIDFGHSAYPALAAAKGQALAIALATRTDLDASGEAYRVDPPYTPRLERLRVDYTASAAFAPQEALPVGSELLHLLPFGVATMAEANPALPPSLLPDTTAAGELLLGLAEVELPQRLSLLVQLAEGTSDPEGEPGQLRWQILDGERWRDLAVQRDDTDGWLHSGVVVLDLPLVAPGRRLPAGLVWLRLTIDQNPTSICEVVDLHAQAVMASFDDQGNSADHYRAPLPPGSVRGLARPEARIAAIEQPYSSFGGRPAEDEDRLSRRVSEGLRHRQRALTAWDVERLALEEFGSRLHKVKCFSGAGGGAVEVIVLPDLRGALPADPLAPKAPANLLAAIERFLRARAPANTVLRVRNATFQPVRIRLGVRFQAGEEERYSVRRLNDDLLRFLSPWAYDDSAEIRIGGTIHATSLVDFVDRLPYVDYVARIQLFLLDGDDQPIPEPGRIREGLQASISAMAPDVVLVSARQHQIDLLTEVAEGERSLTGIGYMQVEFDFIVAPAPAIAPAPP
jgi:hypothetical protein